MKYKVVATVSRESDGWTSTRQIPTFFLDPDIQGIVSVEHAQKIALDIIDPWNTGQVVVTCSCWFE